MTIAYPSDWIAKAAQAFADLADRPRLLFVLLFCVNSLSFPYRGITHDARLYSGQALNRVEEGAYADDLFFRYGSQDEYSLFSRLAAPLVRLLGIHAGFFLVFLLGKSVLIAGMMRLVLTLMPHRAAATLALVYCMAIPIHYGGLHTLNVQENFVTPRMLASGLVLLGLDGMLRGRPILSGAAIFFAAGVHPLMSLAGILIWAGFQVWQYLGIQIFIGTLVCLTVATVLVLAIEPLGIRCFGEMDETWRQISKFGSIFNFPSEWAWDDWYFLTFQFVILGIAIAMFRSLEPAKMRFLILLMGCSMAGTIGAVLAEKLPYALLLQGQPSRILWLMAFLHYPLVFWLCAEALKNPNRSRQLAGCALLAYLCCVNAVGSEFVLSVLLLPLVATVFRGMEKEPFDPDWLVRSLLFSLVVGALGWSLFKTVMILRNARELFLENFEALDVVQIFAQNLGPIFFVAVLAWLLVRIGTERWNRPLWPVWTLVGGLGFQSLVFAIPLTDYYQENCTRYGADLRIIHDLLQREPNEPLPTVYCNLGCLDFVWMDMHAKSYYDCWQGGSFMFRREMALEGQRRAHLVAPFEIERIEKTVKYVSPENKAAIARFFQTPFDRGPVTKKEFSRLCQEQGLDYVVLDHDVKGFPSTQVGHLHLFSCREVRAAYHLPAIPAPAIPVSKRVGGVSPLGFRQQPPRIREFHGFAAS